MYVEMKSLLPHTVYKYIEGKGWYKGDDAAVVYMKRVIQLLVAL